MNVWMWSDDDSSSTTNNNKPNQQTNMATRSVDGISDKIERAEMKQPKLKCACVDRFLKRGVPKICQISRTNIQKSKRIKVYLYPLVFGNPVIIPESRNYASKHEENAENSAYNSLYIDWPN